MKKECWCEPRKSQCEMEWKECYLIWDEWYLTCNKCWFHPNSDLDNLCEHDFN